MGTTASPSQRLVAHAVLTTDRFYEPGDIGSIEVMRMDCGDLSGVKLERLRYLDDVEPWDLAEADTLLGENGYRRIDGWRTGAPEGHGGYWTQQPWAQVERIMP